MLLNVTLDDGNTYLISGSKDKTAIIWSNQYEIIEKITDHTDSIEALTYFETYKILAVGSKDTTIGLWQLRIYEGIALQKINNSNSVTSLAFLPNSSKLVSGEYYGLIKIWQSINDTYECIVKSNRL